MTLFGATSMAKLPRPDCRGSQNRPISHSCVLAHGQQLRRHSAGGSFPTKPPTTEGRSPRAAALRGPFPEFSSVSQGLQQRFTGRRMKHAEVRWNLIELRGTANGAELSGLTHTSRLPPGLSSVSHWKSSHYHHPPPTCSLTRQVRIHFRVAQGQSRIHQSRHSPGDMPQQSSRIRARPRQDNRHSIDRWHDQVNNMRCQFVRSTFYSSIYFNPLRMSSVRRCFLTAPALPRRCHRQCP
jgi:hypothetical protein